MLEVGEDARPIDDAALGSRQALPRGFELTLCVAHASAECWVQFLAFVHICHHV